MPHRDRMSRRRKIAIALSRRPFRGLSGRDQLLEAGIYTPQGFFERRAAPYCRSKSSQHDGSSTRGRIEELYALKRRLMVL